MKFHHSLTALWFALAAPSLLAVPTEIARESFDGTPGAIGFTTSVPQFIELSINGQSDYFSIIPNNGTKVSGNRTLPGGDGASLFAAEDCDTPRTLPAVAGPQEVSLTTNAVNITDGLDGLVAGSSALVFAAFVVISFTQFRHPSAYHLRDAITPALKAGSIDVTVVAAALMGACVGFLWWSAPPARVFMGDTGALALGGAMAGMGLLTNTALLLPIIGGLYVLETASVIAQIISFRGFGRRILRMSPIHHHFELLGWPESTIIVRFWILAGLAMALGLGLFYADFLSIPGVGG